MDAKLFDWLAVENLATQYLNIGVDGSYRFELGSREELHEQVGIGLNVVTQKIIKFMQTRERYEISFNEK